MTITAEGFIIHTWLPQTVTAEVISTKELNNLKAEMARKGYKVADLVAVLGCSEKTARNKLNGGTEFTVGEAFKVRDEMFPDTRMEYLFGPGAA